ncbi:unnamed protein product [Diatraea saccharalis]|uniref:DNA-directed RNA polymerase I subunit RPA49 n=1 Tax=Diatraea saccharalis TaxID=40085 RepID=A0A9N9WFA9_9NEOP|nr:unnamed protein product [Diatraea saccharalis]
MPKIHIDEIYPKNSVYPMVVNFQNGYVTDALQSQSCVLLQNKNNGEKALATKISGLIYSGNEVKDDFKTLILARNKITGKVRLIETGIAELKPMLKTDNNKTNTELDTSYLELSRKFGSKKHKKIVEHREKLKVNVQTVTEQMHNVTVNITEDQFDLSSYIKTDSDDFYIPPINRDADKPEDVYDLHKILSKEQYDEIYSEMEKENYKSELLPWIKDIVETKKNMPEELTVLALYASVLLKLFSILTKEIVKKNFVICAASPTLNKIVLQNFTTNVNGKRNRPLQYKDKAFCHALVFLLLINNLKYDLDEISKNVKFSLKTFMAKFKVIGATIVTSGSKKIAQLKLPLSTVSTGRRKSAKF